MGRNISLSHADPKKRDYPVTCDDPLPVEICAGDVQASIGSTYLVPPLTKSFKLTGNQAAVTVLTPTSGKRLQIIGVYPTSDDSVFDTELSFSSSALTVIQVFEAAQLGSTIPMNITGAVNEVLEIDIADSASSNWFFIVNYAEVD